MKQNILSATIVALAIVGTAQAQTYTLAPLTSFAGDGWLAPGEGGISYLGTGLNERGFAYNSATGNLLLVSRSGGLSVRVLDGTTAASEGSLGLGTGVITGGTFTGSMIGVAGDGAIYLANLASPVAGANPFKVYRWANEAATPTLAYSSTTVSGGRLGDSFDVLGSGASTLLVAGESSVAGSGARNGYVVLTTANGLDYSGTLVAFTGTPPNGGDHRFGLTFLDGNTVIGSAGGSWRLSDFAGSVGTLVDSSNTTTANERAMDYAVIGGVGYLATLDTANSLVRIYNLSDANNPALVASANNTSGDLTAGNGTGQVKFGAISGNTATVYAMGANQGIQAMTFTVVPEPEEYAMLAAGGLIAFGVWRRIRR
jgi:hypothetical protein